MIPIDGESCDPSDEDALNDPTPEQIRRRAEAIRKRWSDKQRRRRRVLPKLHWLPPIIGIDDLTADISSVHPN